VLCYEVRALRWIRTFLALSVTACTGAITTTGFTPITSIVLRAESVIPAGQCGSAPNQFAKYTAVISSISDSGDESIVRGGGTYSCYSDAMFANLPAPQTNLSFSIHVFMWSEDDYKAAVTAPAIASKLADPAQIAIDAGPGLFAELRTLKATATRYCRAAQISSVQSVAQCDALKTDAKKKIRVTDAGSDSATDSGSGDSGIAEAGSD
jgi:hypothetical protein